MSDTKPPLKRFRENRTRFSVKKSRPPIIVICGPTASGKNALALALAARQPSTIINMDASQVYRDIPILSAQPSAEERAQAPHRLFGHVDGAASYSAARWADEARAAIAEAQGEGRVPILVGGTGLYMRTLLDGIAPVPEIDAQVRADVREMPVYQAYAALLSEDPAAASRLNPHDASRVARAVEVVRSTGRPLHEWQAERVGGIGDRVELMPVILLPPRKGLMARCDARFAAMIEAGALQEVELLLARGLSPALPVMRAIGVRELGECHKARHAELDSASITQASKTSDAGEWTLKQVQGDGCLSDAQSLHSAIAAAQLATRQYAKRQYTWFRNQCPPDWLRALEPLTDDETRECVIKLLNLRLTQ